MPEDQGSILRETLQSQDGLNLGDVHFCPIRQTPTMQHGTLCNDDVLHNGYRPKMLLYALDELFYIFDQVKRQ